MPWIDFRISRLVDKPIPNKHIMKTAIIRLLRITRGLTRKISAEEILNILKDLQLKYNRSNYNKKGNSSDSAAMELVRRLMKKVDHLEEKLDAQDRRRTFVDEKRFQTMKFAEESPSIRNYNPDTHRPDNKDNFRGAANDLDKSDKSINRMISYFDIDKKDDSKEE
jgi:uncharacterized protein involved in copper resistance